MRDAVKTPRIWQDLWSLRFFDGFFAVLWFFWYNKMETMNCELINFFKRCAGCFKAHPEKLKTNWFCLAVFFVVSLAAFFFILSLILTIPMDGYYLNDARVVEKKDIHLKKPDQTRGIYLTAYTAGSRRFDELVDFVKKNNLNTMVIDVQGPYGEPAFRLNLESLQSYSPEENFYDVEEVIKKLHDNNIYAIARIFIFQNPYLVKKSPEFALRNVAGGFWTDYKGVKWLDPTHYQVWQYNSDLAREVYDRGFDEVNLDYIRFPSDGNLKTIKYAGWDGSTPKEEEMEKFFKYISDNARKYDIPISADLFGLVCCNADDLGVGQVLERALPYFDYISPMMYPSHYASGFIGLKNPASYPYEVVKYSMERSMERREKMAASTTAPLAKIRPWIQDFDLGAVYDASKVKAQIKAAEETQAEGFLIWNARNVYTWLGE